MAEASANSYHLCVQVKRGTSLIINKQSAKFMVIASFSDLLEAINRRNNSVIEPIDWPQIRAFISKDAVQADRTLDNQI
jgi:hypothetical protein